MLVDFSGKTAGGQLVEASECVAKFLNAWRRKRPREDAVDETVHVIFLFVRGHNLRRPFRCIIAGKKEQTDHAKKLVRIDIARRSVRNVEKVQ